MKVTNSEYKGQITRNGVVYEKYEETRLYANGYETTCTKLTRVKTSTPEYPTHTDYDAKMSDILAAYKEFTKCLDF